MRYVSVLLLGLVAAAVVAGAGGYTGVEADRSVSVAVVDDESAYLGVAVDEKRVTENKTQVFLRLTNRFTEPATLEVRSAAVEWKPESKRELEPGESRKVHPRATVRCPSEGERRLDVTVTADGEGVSARKERTLTLCDEPPIGGPSPAGDSESSTVNSTA